MVVDFENQILTKMCSSIIYMANVKGLTVGTKCLTDIVSKRN
jgi:hypothetical protein